MTITIETLPAPLGSRRPHLRACCDVCGWRSMERGLRREAESAGERHVADYCKGVRAPARPVYLGYFEHDSEPWHAARADGLGGSEVSALLGLSPWESEFSLWHRKSGIAQPEPVNDEMRAGTLLEPVIVGKFASDHPDWLVQPKAGTWRHATDEWRIANPDALVSRRDPANPTVVQGCLLETKFSVQGHGWGEPGTDEIPPYYYCQVQWYLAIFGLDVCFVMVFFGGSARFAEYEVHADAAMQAKLLDAGARFRASLAAGVRPPIDGHDATYQVVRDLHPDIEDGRDVPVPAELARAFCEAKHAVKTAEKEAKRQTSLLAEHMGSAQRAVFAGRRLARRQSKGGGIPYVQAEADLPFGPVLEEIAS